jgi:hypothetical protein
MTALPTILYRSPGPYVGPPVDGSSTTYATLGVSDEKAFADALAAGWCATLPEAVSPPASAPAVEHAASEAVAADVPDAPPTRDELKAMAAQLGLTFDGRISDAKLKALIDAAIAEKE